MPPSRAEELLGCALAYRAAQLRQKPAPVRYDDATHAVGEMMAVLLHEARESLAAPLAAPPERPFLHPVDVDTDIPGIVDKRDELHVLRATAVPRPVYTARPGRTQPAPAPPPAAELAPRVDCADAGEAAAKAQADLAAALAKAQRGAGAVEKRAVRAAEVKAAREAESPEAREARLAEARQKREARKREREAKAEPAPAPRRPRVSPPASEEALLVPDHSAAAVLAPAPRRRAGSKLAFFEAPLPHDRHLRALERCAPHASLLPALLRGEACDALEVLQGPPGTGKTRSLVARLPAAPVRVYLCGPTNVAAANLYARCVAEGLGAECALVLSPDRVPPGTAVLSNDPGRRIVCATVSARAGPALNGKAFEAVFLDEAGQTCEAWCWTLLRPEVTHVVLAGDVRQLPAHASESGRALRHERSLMERLVVDLGYDNVATLAVQNRMAPALLAFPNAEFYGGSLKCGPHAPTDGAVEWRVLEDAHEAECGTSYSNAAEAAAAAEAATSAGARGRSCSRRTSASAARCSPRRRDAKCTL